MRLGSMGCVTAATWLATLGVAHAQGAAPSTPSSPSTPSAPATAPADGAAAPATNAPPAPGATTAGAAEAPAPPDDPADKVRFRFAVHLAGGPWILPKKMGGAGGIGLQLGVQINDYVGVYYSPMAGIGVAYGAAGAYVYNTVQADLTLARILQVGVGPSLDTFAFGDVNVSSNGGSALAVAGTFFGANARVGVALGANKPGKRGVFMLGLELHPTFISGEVPMSALITLGGGSF